MTYRPQVSQLRGAIIKEMPLNQTFASQEEGEQYISKLSMQLLSSELNYEQPVNAHLPFECLPCPAFAFDLFVRQICSGDFPLALAHGAWSTVVQRVDATGPLDRLPYREDFAESIFEELVKIGMIEPFARDIATAIDVYKQANSRELQSSALSLTDTGKQVVREQLQQLAAVQQVQRDAKNSQPSEQEKTRRWFRAQLEGEPNGRVVRHPFERRTA